MRRLAFLIALVFAASAFAGVSVNKRYRSALNPDRPVRKSTELIVLHTTEAPAKSSLRHTSERGLCHYCVVEDGTIYQIVDRHRVAFHAGCSMWNGKEEVDEFSVGIECVGYHNKAMPKKQLDAIRALVEELQKIYGIPDDRVVTHSQVAYGSPNKWHKCKHRGRKRCGMLFAMPSVRSYLKLKTRPLFDPDVRAKRLVVKDAYLNKMLYTSADTMVASYGKGSVKGVDPTKSRVGVKIDKGEKKENFFVRFGKKIKKLCRDLVSEMKKVVWLSKDETKKSSILVIVTVVAIAAAIGVIDTVFSAIINFIAGLIG